MHTGTPSLVCHQEDVFFSGSLDYNGKWDIWKWAECCHNSKSSITEDESNQIARARRPDVLSPKSGKERTLQIAFVRDHTEEKLTWMSVKSIGGCASTSVPRRQQKRTAKRRILGVVDEC